MAKAEEVGISTDSQAFYVWLNRKEQATSLEKAFAEAAVLAEKRASTRPLPAWYQLLPQGDPAVVVEPTRFGTDPLDYDPENHYRCPLGHTGGLNVLSELWIKRSSWGGRDLCFTNQLVNYHRPDSVIYPAPLVIVSPKLRSLLLQHKIKGFKTEIAHLAHNGG